MPKLPRFVSKNSIRLLIFLFLICAAFDSAAGAITTAAISEKETEARRLSLEWNAGSIRRSVNLYAESAADWERFDELQSAARCLREAALLLTISAEYRAATEKLEKALRLDVRTRFTEGRIITLSILSRVAYQAGDTGKSEKYYREALALSETTDSAAAKANALYSAAEYKLFFGDVGETIVLYEKALEHAEKAGDQRLVAQILVNLGFAYFRQGNNFTGLEKERRALEKAEETGDRRAQAIALNGLGSLYYLEEKRTALELFQRAEAMYPEDFDWLEKGKLLNGIATIYEDYGEFALAENYRQRAFELFGKSKYPYGQLATLPSLAKLKWLKGERDAGKQLYDETLRRAAELKSDFHVAIVREDLGELDFKDGALDRAIGNYLEAQKVYEKLKINLPRIQTKLGEVYAAKNDFRRAREYFAAALDTSLRTKDMLPAAENLFHLARLEQSEGRTAAALEKIKESLAITESVYRNAANNRLGSSFISNIYDRYELFINLLMKMQKLSPETNAYALEALQAAEKSRARVMLENLSLAEANFTKDADVATVRREKEIRVLLNAKSDKLTDLLSRRAAESETEKHTVEIAELEFELENIKARLREQSPVYSAIRNPAPFDAADFQKNVLDENSLLIEFSLGSEESYLWLVSRDEISFFILPPRREIASHIENLRSFLKARELRDGEALEDFQKRIGEAEAAYRRDAAELSRKLFSQIAGKFAGKRLIVVPDAELHYFPVGALPLPGAPLDAPILLTNEVVYEPSAQTLAVLAKSRRPRAPKNLLVFSDPVFALDDVRFAGNKPAANAETASAEQFRFIESLSNLTRLPASKLESETIVEIIGGAEAENFSGFSATRENLLNLKTADYRILHFATHGLTDETRPELSGVALSGFDENGRKLNQLFRIQDIYALDLNAELVVLSACATGAGKHLKGEGLMSLNNAFLQSGAKTVVASLWKVEDGATLELMRHFYSAMAHDNQTPSEALRRAQLKLRENPKYKSPFFWAAFTVQGDFRNVPQISGGYGFWTYVLPVAPLALFGFYLYRRRKFSMTKK